MRENKFRVWCLDKKEWEKDFCVMGHGGTIFHVINSEIVAINPARHIAVFYTGLKDKNGVEIYEGDILKVESETVKMMTGVKTGNVSIYLFRIVWLVDSWGYEIFKNIQGYPGVVPHTSKGIVIYVEGAEIIGNVYENPELLKDNK